MNTEVVPVPPDSVAAVCRAQIFLLSGKHSGSPQEQ